MLQKGICFKHTEAFNCICRCKRKEKRTCRLLSSSHEKHQLMCVTYSKYKCTGRPKGNTFTICCLSAQAVYLYKVGQLLFQQHPTPSSVTLKYIQWPHLQALFSLGLKKMSCGRKWSDGLIVTNLCASSGPLSHEEVELYIVLKS